MNGKLEDDLIYRYFDFKLLKEGIFESGNYGELPWFIVSIGHPCSYIMIPKEHPFYEKECREINKYNVSIHGGVTYSQEKYHLDETRNREGYWVIGWDYAHGLDLIKKWTLVELEKEMKTVLEEIDQK